MLRAADQERPLPPERLTTAAFLRLWLTSIELTVRPSTFRSYSGIVECHLIPGLGRLRLVELGPREVESLLRAKLGAGLSPRTVEMIRAVLRQALNRGMRWGYVERNAAALATAPRVTRHRVDPMSTAQARHLLDAVRGDRLETLYAVALALGLRQGEALGLSWADVDFEAGSLRVNHALQRVDGQLRLVEPKSESSRRLIPMPRLASEALAEHRRRQKLERMAAGSLWIESGLVFTTRHGGPLDGGNVTKQFQAHLEVAGLPRIRFHDLRHACATLLLAQGVPARVVMETLGHSQISLTLDTYAHVVPILQRDAAERMDEALRLTS